MFVPMPMELQVTVIYAGTNGFVDDYPVAVLDRYETELLSFMKARKQDVLDELKSAGKLEGDIEKRLRDALTEFAKQFSDRGRNELAVSVVDHRARRRGDTDHEGAGRRRRAQRDAAPGIERGHLDHAAADAEQRRQIARDK